MAAQDFYAFAGIRNTLSPERLGRAVKQAGGIDQRTDLTEAVNVDIDDSGRVARRAGQTTVLAGACHSVWATDSICLFVQDGALMRLMPDFSTAILRSGMTDQAVSYAEVNGRIYWSDGTQTGTVIDGVARAWGMLPPAYQPRMTPITGHLTAGTYQCSMTFLGGDGQESGTGVPDVIKLGEGGGLRFSWPAPTDPGIVEVAIYLSTANGEALYQALVVDAAAGQVDFMGGALALPMNTQWLDAPPPGQALAYHRGRIFIAQGAFLYATSALGYSYVDLRDYLALDDSFIRFVAGVEHGLYVGTDKAVYFLHGDDLNEMTLTSVVDGYGVAGSALIVDGAVATGDDKLAGSQCAMFATELGVCFGTPDGTVTNLTSNRYRSKIDRIGSSAFRVDPTHTQYLLSFS